MKAFIPTFSQLSTAILCMSGLAVSSPVGEKDVQVPRALELDVVSVSVIIKPIGNPNLCWTASGGNQDSPQMLSPCVVGASSQIWLVTQQGNNIYQFQNAQTVQCAQSNFDPFDHEPVTNSGCVIAGTNNPISNTEWYTGTSSITANNLPVVITRMENRIHFASTNYCIDSSGNSLFMALCSDSLSQTWLVYQA